jgi:hypothetical protein
MKEERNKMEMLIGCGNNSETVKEKCPALTEV